MKTITANQVKPGQFVVGLGTVRAVHHYPSSRAVTTKTLSPFKGKLDRPKAERIIAIEAENQYVETETDVTVEGVGFRKTFASNHTITVAA